MGPATLAVTEVSHVPVQADKSAPEERPADDELDVLFDLGDEIATLAAHLHAATYRLLTLIAEFDQLGGWEPEGHRSCAHWLAFRTGIDLGAAGEKVRAARALTALPQISASMEQGELSFARVRALTRVATPESEGDLLELARCSTAPASSPGSSTARSSPSRPASATAPRSGGLTALFAMLNSCAPGLTVVNIDNGFGGGYAAAQINRTRS